MPNGIRWWGGNEKLAVGEDWIQALGLSHQSSGHQAMPIVSSSIYTAHICHSSVDNNI